CGVGYHAVSQVEAAEIPALQLGRNGIDKNNTQTPILHRSLDDESSNVSVPKSITDDDKAARGVESHAEPMNKKWIRSAIAPLLDKCRVQHHLGDRLVIEVAQTIFSREARHLYIYVRT